MPTGPRRVAELETAFPDDVIVRFGEGDARAIGVYRRAIDDRARGVVVVVLGPGMTADAAVDSTFLRRSLPRERWATLTITLPDEANEVIPPRQRGKAGDGAPVAAPNDTAQAPTKALSPAPDLTPALVRARLDTAVKAAREKGAKVVVLGELAAGAWIVWAQQQGLGADAVVAINTPRNSPRIDGQTPRDTLAALKSPALLLFETPFDWSVDDRLAADVTLRRLPPGNPAGERLDRQIRGWLNRRFDSRG